MSNKPEWIAIRSSYFNKRWFVAHYHKGANLDIINKGYWFVTKYNNHTCNYYSKLSCDKKAPEHLIKLVKLINFMSKL